MNLQKSIFFILLTTLFFLSANSQNTRPPTTGHSVDAGNGHFGQAPNFYFGGQKSDGSLSNELWREHNGQFTKINVTGGPSPRKDHTSFFNETKNTLVITGGIDQNGNCLTDFWEFNFNTNTWTLVNPNYMACASEQTSQTNNDKAYVAGGKNSNNESVATFSKIDLSSTSYTLTQLPAMVEPLQGGGSLIKNNTFYYVGGKNHDWDPNTPGNQASYSANIWKYNLSSKENEKGIWELVTTSGNFTELTEMASVTDSTASYFYVFGGKTYDYQTNTELYNDEIFKLNLSSFTWQKIGTLPSPLANATAIFTKTNVIWILNGETKVNNNVVVSDKIYEFDPITNAIVTYNPVSVSELINQGNISISPNPVDQLLTINGISGNFSVFIYDIDGRLICNRNITNNQIDVNILKKGLYFIKIVSGDKVILKSFIKN